MDPSHGGSDEAEQSKGTAMNPNSSSMPTTPLENAENVLSILNSEEDRNQSEPRRGCHSYKRKGFYRHTQQQITELEKLFMQCPHPEERQRLELSKKIGLGTRSIKFWFQNRRTQLKAQVDRFENTLLRVQLADLKAENSSLKTAYTNPSCRFCRSPTMVPTIPFEQQQLLVENAILRDRIYLVSALSEKFLGVNLSRMNVADGLNNVQSTVAAPEPAECTDNPAGSVTGLAETAVRGNGELDLWDIVTSAMEELLQMAQLDLLWVPGGRTEKLNTGMYYQKFRRTSTAMSSRARCVSVATRDTGIVNIETLSLVEALMDSASWREMFPCLIARATDPEVLFEDIDETKNQALLHMQAEFQFLSPLVPVFEVNFVRFAEQLSEGNWAIVDVSVDETLSSSDRAVHCRRLPSGCLIQKMLNGYSKVTWVEHLEYDENSVHEMYRPLVRSGLAFGAERWLASLQSQCERNSVLKSSTIIAASLESGIAAGMTVDGQRSILKLAQRMTKGFCNGICMSSNGGWDRVRGDGISEDVKVMMRKSFRKRGEPTGVVMSAATSVVIPVEPQKLFQFLRNARRHAEWDILSNEAAVEISHIALDVEEGNAVCLLHGIKKGGEDDMVILQETRSDRNGSHLVVYTPVDVPDMKNIIAGDDSSKTSILPCGFAIAPCTETSYANYGIVGGSAKLNVGPSSLLTVSVQLLVSDQPSEVTLDSVETADRLVTCTVQRIKASVMA